MSRTGRRDRPEPTRFVEGIAEASGERCGADDGDLVGPRIPTDQIWIEETRDLVRVCAVCGCDPHLGGLASVGRSRCGVREPPTIGRERGGCRGGSGWQRDSLQALRRAIEDEEGSPGNERQAALSGERLSVYRGRCRPIGEGDIALGRRLSLIHISEPTR